MVDTACKPRVMLFLAAALLSSALVLAGCGSDSGHAAPVQQQGVSNVLEERMRESEVDEGSDGFFVGDAKSAYGRVDYDLTKMSADMVYATVFDMVSYPSDYAGTSVRAAGPFYHTYDEETARDYYYVVVRDATACCAQGLEFEWGGAHVWPEDYPAEEQEVIVTGVFQTYQEGAKTYVHLVDASLEAA